MESNEDPQHPEFSRLLELMTLSDGRVASELGVSTAAVRSWRTGRRSPSVDNRSQLLAVARGHAYAILHLARSMEGRDDEPPIDPPVAVDLVELRRQMEKTGAEAASIQRALEETTRLLAQQG